MPSNSRFARCLQHPFNLKGSTILLVAALGAACAGSAGPAGPAGEMGPAGPQGPTGQNGADGTDGTNGTNGTDGTDGAQGATGATGATGAQGATGATGAQGLPGQDGTDATVDPLLPPIDKAFAGAGGEAAITGMTGFTIVASGTRGVAAEGFAPTDFYPTVSTFAATIHNDVANDRMRLDYERDVYTFGYLIETSFSEIIRGQLGAVDGSESVYGFPGGAMTSDRWASVRRQQRLLNPQLILQEIAADPTIATDKGVQLLDGSVHHIIEVEDPVRPLQLYVNAATGHLAKLMTWENDHLFSDIAIEVFYYGWAPPTTGSVLFPTQVYLAADGNIVHTETRTSVDVNPTLAATLFDFPDGVTPAFDQAHADLGESSHQFHQAFTGIGIPLDGQQLLVTPTEVVPGVWHLQGGSHHSLLVEQASGLVLVDAPLYPERSVAIKAWLDTQFPTKEVTHVVVSHFHRDHTGGLREFVADGATIVVGEESREFFADVFSAPRTVHPDALQDNPVAPVFQLVGSMPVTLTDATHAVEVYPIDSTHATDLNVVLVNGVAFIVDIYNPNFGPPNAGAVELYDAIETDWELTVDHIVGGHGAGSITYANFVTALTDAGLITP